MAELKVLLTGFNAFGGNSVNSSEVIVRAIATIGQRPWLITEILRTEFAAAGQTIVQLLSTHRPDICLCLGLHERADCVVIERCAFNRDDATIADNAGFRAGRRETLARGAHCLRATVPIDAMGESLKQHDIPFRFSDSAGGFVCNHVFYLAASEIERLGSKTRVGFIHLPSITNLAESAPGLPAEQLAKAVELCIEACRKTLTSETFARGDNP
jgi:pyroglutamyl-peptidase